MNYKTILLAVLILFSNLATIAQEKVYKPGKFKNIIISPHIEATFEKGDEEKVEVIETSEPLSKMNVELKNGTLHIFLDDTKLLKQEAKSPYSGTIAEVKITYVNLLECDLRGEEDISFNSNIEQTDFRLAIYGESMVSINQLDVSDFRVTIYGESELYIENGTVDYQKYTAYGSSIIEAENVKSRQTKITTYGSGEFSIHVDEKLKVTSFGESIIEYSGDPSSKKVKRIGSKSSITKID